MTVVEVLVDSGKTQNEKEAKRFRDRMPSAIDRNFPAHRGALLLVSASAIVHSVVFSSLLVWRTSFC